MSEYLECVVCQEIFKEPTRLGCGHTYCRQCVSGLQSTSNKCPECREGINLQKVKQDLIAYGLINEQLVYCKEREYCKWQGQVKELGKHIQQCDICVNGVPEYLKKLDRKNNIELTQEQEILGDRFTSKLNQNLQGSLLQRLYQKEKDNLHNVLEDKQKAQNTEQKKSEEKYDEFENFLDELDKPVEKQQIQFDNFEDDLQNQENIQMNNNSKNIKKKGQGRKKRSDRPEYMDPVVNQGNQRMLRSRQN